MSLAAAVTAVVDALQSLDSVGMVQSRPVRLELITSLASGVGPGLVDQVWAARFTVAASSDEVIAFADMEDPFGSSLTFARVRVAMFKVAASSALLGVEIGCGDADAKWFLAANEGGTISPVYVRPGGAAMYVAPDEHAYAVDHDEIRLVNLDNDVPAVVDLVLVGASQ